MRVTRNRDGVSMIGDCDRMGVVNIVGVVRRNISIGICACDRIEQPPACQKQRFSQFWIAQDYS